MEEGGSQTCPPGGHLPFAESPEDISGQAEQVVSRAQQAEKISALDFAYTNAIPHSAKGLALSSCVA